jgi:hypothetical protein
VNTYYPSPGDINVVSPVPHTVFDPCAASMTNEIDFLRCSIANLDQLIANARASGMSRGSDFRGLVAGRKKLARKLLQLTKHRGVHGMGDLSGSSALVWLFAGYVAYKYLFKGR